MKSSLRKLRGFSLAKNGSKEKLGVDRQRQQQSAVPQFDDFTRATQDLQDLKECYDGLVSASAHAANTAYEFSGALQEMGTCLLEKTALNTDEDSGRVLIMLGKVQYELHKIIDRYRAHISQTITIPSDSLLSELQNVEEMKCQCDEKREIYDLMRTERAKGKSKTGKGESLWSQQLQSVKEEYDGHATLLIFRLMSLKQGQSRSLLTQAARHYAAQLRLFRKGLASLEALEPHVKQIAEQQHIDYELDELEEDDGEVSFEFIQNDPELNESTSSENSMQLDKLDSSPPSSAVHAEITQAQASVDKTEEYSHATGKQSRAGSKSAPISPSIYKKSEGIEKIQDTLPSISAQRNLHTYALPIPAGARSINATGGGNNIGIRTRPAGGSGAAGSIWHTSPLEKYRNHNGPGVASAKSDLNLLEPAVNNSKSAYLSRQISRAQPLPEEPNTSTRANPKPPLPSSVERVPLVRFETPLASNSKRIKTLAYSGPLIGKSWAGRPAISGSGPLAPPQVEASFKSGPVTQSSVSRAFSSPKNSPSISPTNLSPPHINELYELPRPPTDSAKPLRSSSVIAHSAPLARRNRELSMVPKPGPVTSRPASPLPPPPPGLVTRSFSIPSSGQKGQVLLSAKGPEVSQQIRVTEEVPSPPLTPIPFPNSKGISSSAEASGGAENLPEAEIGQTVRLPVSSPASELGQNQSIMNAAHGHLKM